MRKHEAMRLSTEPKITIGIPAYNEQGRIRRLLDGLLLQKNPWIMEILVNASGSTDETVTEVREIARSSDKNCCTVRLINSKHRLGKAAAMDEILCGSSGNLIIFIDADTDPDSNCIKEIVGPLLKDESVGIVSGNVLPVSSRGGSTLLASISKFQRELHHQFCIILMNKGLPVKVNGTFFAVRRDLVKHIPHDVISDDEYISFCVQDAGYKVAYAPAAKVYTSDPTNLVDYFSKRRRILGGHFMIRNTLGYDVPTVRITLLLPTFGMLTVRYWREAPFIPVMLFLELWTRVFAFVDALRRSVSPYYRVDSAKFLP